MPITFSQWNQQQKTLRNALADLLDERSIRDCDIDPGARAETLPVAAFVALARRAAESY